MLRALSMGRLMVSGVTILACVKMIAFLSINNALNYTEVEATVHRVGQFCRPKGAPAESAVACGDFQSTSDRNKTIRNTIIYLRYRPPADGREYGNSVRVTGGKKAVNTLRLRSGDRWTIMAHDDEPLKIKADRAERLAKG